MTKNRREKLDSGFWDWMLESGWSLKSRKINRLWHFQNPIWSLDWILGFWKISSQFNSLTPVPESNSTTSPYGRGRPERRPLPRVGDGRSLEDAEARVQGPA
jgi:hypothetical protein